MVWLSPADVTSSAWQTALSTGALSEIPDGAVAELSDVYTVQNRLDAFTASYIPVIDLSDAAMSGTVRRMNIYVQTLLSYEHYLITHYDTALRKLEAVRS